MNNEKKIFLAVVVIILLLIAGALVKNSYRKTHHKIPYYSFNMQSGEISTSRDSSFTVGDFSFTDQNGKVVTQKEVGNVIYVADYFFASCPGICKAMANELQKVYITFKDEPRVKIVSYTSKPEEDSTEALMNYAMRNGVTDHNKWLFLTGDKKHLYKLAREQYFIVNDVGDGGEDDFIHTERLVLIDPDKHIRGYYDGTSEQDVQKLIKDIKSLLNEF